jgi:hypothetical protein
MTQDSSDQGPPGRDGDTRVDSAAAKGRAGGWSLFKKRGGDLVDKLAGTVKDATRNPLLKQALEARERGNLAASFYLLEEAFTEKAEKDGDLVIAGAFWDVAVEYERAEDAVHAVAVLIRHYAGSNECELAAQYWSELAPRVTDALAEPSSLIRIVPILQEQVDEEPDEDALVQRQQVLLLALKAIVNPANTGLSPGLAVRTAELARELDPDSALAAAHVALEADDLHQAKRERLQQLICELDPNAPALPAPPPPEPIPEPEPEAEVGAVEQDESGHGPARNHPLRADSRPAMGLSDAEAIALRAKLPVSQPGSVALGKAVESTQAVAPTVDTAQAVVDAVEQSAERMPADTAAALDAAPEASIGSTLDDAPDLEVDFNADSQPELEVDPFAESNPDIDVDLESPARRAATAEPEPESEPTPELDAAFASEAGTDTEPSCEPESDAEEEDLLVSLEPVSDGPPSSLPEPEVMVFDVPLEPRADAARFSDAKVIPGRATELDDGGVWLDVQGGRRTRIEYDKIQALAVARIAELGVAPVAILDLLLNWNDDSDAPLRLVRLRSDEIDVEGLGGGASNGDAALLYVAAEILSQCHPIPLPDPDAVLTGNMPAFDSLAGYELEVLEVSR